MEFDKEFLWGAASAAHQVEGAYDEDEKGLQFYINLVDELVNAGITLMCTLFHWNLLMWAHEWGGWENEKTIGYIEEYTKVVVDALSDKVSYWIISTV